MNLKTAPTKHELLLAMACHQVISAYNLSRAEVYPQTKWDALPDEVKDSSILGVRRALMKETKPSDMWETWKAHRKENGWTWGPTKSDPFKEHPNLVDDYSLLPEHERRKDELFIETVRLLQGALA